MRENAQRRDRPSPIDRCLPPPHTEHRHLSPLSKGDEELECVEPFRVFKMAGNGEPALIEGTPTLEAAVARVMGLRACFPGEYLIISQATGKRIVFTTHGAINRS